MANLFNVASTVAGVGSQVAAIIFADKTSIGDVTIGCTLEETYSDSMEITDHPVESGATISDHCFKRPREITIHGGFSSSSSWEAIMGIGEDLLSSFSYEDYLTKTYNRLRALQESRTPFRIVTGLRTYENMLMQDLTVIRNKETQNVLDFTAICREVQIAYLSTVQVPASEQSFPELTQKKIEEGSQQLKPVVGVVDEASGLYQIKDTAFINWLRNLFPGLFAN